MKIGFDAKRLFHNGTGLGNYSRSLVSSLYNYFPKHDYVLFTPSVKYNEESFFFTEKFHVVTPGAFSKIAWRSRFILNQMLQENIDIYHGLSHEVPFGIENTSIKSVVTIHDLIYRFFPEDFPLIDKKVYDMKWRNACKNADAIIATSQATKNDIIEYFNVDENKIHVVYQTCNPIFENKVDDNQKSLILQKFHLPQSFLLYVGAISDRKNVFSLVRAYGLIKHEINLPLIIVGNGRSQLQKIKDYILQHNLEQNIRILSNVENDDLPALYQAAKIFLYPSKYEGFGIPIVEALKSGTPVITTQISSLPEVAGDAALYVEPTNIEHIAETIRKVCFDEDLYNVLISNGSKQSKLFSLEHFANKTIDVYNEVYKTIR